MSFLLTGLLGPLIGGLVNHGSNGSLEGALLQNQVQDENDQISTIMTNTALSARATKMANIVSTQTEHVRETSMYDDYVLSVQGAEDKILQKQMKEVDDSTA